MAVKVIQNSFSGGELSPAMFGRIDDSKYAFGLATCRNLICRAQGPAENRSGFAFVRAAKYADRPCRLIPFTFSSDQTMVLELGDKYVRFHTQGQTLLGEDGDPYEIETPYEADDLDEINYSQSADVVTLVHPRYAPRELRRYGATDWRLVEVDFGAPLSAPTNLEAEYTCNAKSDYITEEAKTMYKIGYKVTAVVDTDEGVEESEASEAVTIQANLFIDDTRIDLTWDAVAGADRYRVYKSYSGVYGFIAETENTEFTDTNTSPDESITPPRWDDPFLQSKGIQEVSVVNGGSGYSYVDRGAVLESPINAAQPSFKEYAKRGDATTLQEYRKLKYEKTDLGRTGPIWQESNQSTGGGYPEYPDAEPIKELAASLLEVEDLSGLGSGAVVEPIFSVRYSHDVNYDSSDSGGGDRYYSTTSVELTGVKITNSGSRYSEPVVRVYSAGGLFGGNVYRWVYRLDVKTSGLSLTVTDTTGSGAQLEPVVSNGVITDVRIVNPGSGYSNPQVVIKAETGSGASITASTGATGDYPGAVAYFQQRRIFAGTLQRPQFVWMTRPGKETDMSYTIPSQADNRIKFRVATNEASRIRHVVPLSSLLLLSASTEFRVTTANDDTLTPTSIDVRAQSYVGAAAAQPLLVNSLAVYAAARGGHIREIGYQYNAGGFVTGDISLRSEHLFDGKSIRSLALMKAPTPIVWAVNSDGELLGCTYIPEQNLGGWHRHDTINGKFESIACVAEGDEDALYAVVRRTINGKTVRYIERMHERIFTSLEDCFFVDSGATYEGEPTDTISGLTWLEGETVTALADGKTVPSQTVVDGKITLPIKASRIHVGLPIVAELRTLPAAFQDKYGGYGRGVRKNAVMAYVRVFQTSGVAMGPDEDSLINYSQRKSEPYGSPPEVASKEIGMELAADWTDGGQITIRQIYPLPMTIVSIAIELAT